MRQNDINAGELNRRIMLQKKAESEGPFVDLSEYRDYKPTWAKVWHLNDRQIYAARSANIKTDVDFTIRYRTDLDISMRIVYDNEIYEIDSIKPLDNKRSYLVISTHIFRQDM